MEVQKETIDIPNNHKIIIPKINPFNDNTENIIKNDKKNSQLNSSKKSNSDISELEIEEDNYMDKQLSLLLEIFLTSYSKRRFQELIKDIEEKEILLSSNFLSFKILIVKIKCFLKLLLKEYNNILQIETHNYHEIENIIQKIQKEFKKIFSLVIINNTSEFEILCQVYCKFLYILSKISLKKEDNIKSLGYLSLGINMLKIVIVRKKIVNDIRTYKIYSKLLLSLINILIGDNNYEKALLYCRTLLKVLEISKKFIFYNKGENNDIIYKNKMPSIIEKKFINYAGYTFLYIGCCLEQFEKDIEAFEAYKQAKYFLIKGSISGNPFKNVNIVNINNSCNYLAVELTEKLNLKFKKEKIELLQMQSKIEKLKRLQKYQLLKSEKQYKLKLIANGHIGDPFKYNHLEEKINKLLFPSSIKNDLDRNDDDLMSFVYTYLNINTKSAINKKRISTNTKKLLSRYELYNILMSENFRDFVKKTKKLQFNNPKKVSESVNIIQRHLNKKIDIKFEMKEKNKHRKKTMKSFEKPNNSIKLINNINSKNVENNTINSITFRTTTQNSISKRGEEREDKFIFKNNYFKKKIKKKNIKLNLIALSNKEIVNNSLKKINNRNFSFSNHFSKRIASTIIKGKKKINKNYINQLECDFERKNFDKNLMTKNYLRKYSYYEKLSNKELKLQKVLLDFRNNNSLYSSKKALEDNDSKIITKEEIINKFLMIDEEVKEKEKKNNMVKDEDLKMLNSFVLGISKMKSAMSRVINRYIQEKEKNAKNNMKILTKEEIKQNNEKNLLELNYSIKNIKNNISRIRQITGNHTYH